MKRKAMALILCLALIVTATLPGTLAVSIDQGTIVGNFQAETPTTEATTEGTTEASTETTVPTDAPQETTLATEPGDTTGGDQNSTDATDTGETTPPTEVTTEPTDPQCTCGREDGEHDEGCPLYEEPGENPEGKPPVQDTEGLNRGPAYRFTNVAPLIQFDMPATLDLFGEKARATDNGVVLNKTATANDDGTFDITLEAYVTGATSIEQKDVVADVVLVLDTSGSMSQVMNKSDLYPVYGNMTRDTVNGNYQYTEHVLRDTDGNLMSNNSNYFSRYQKYYIEEDGELIQVWWSNGWRTNKTWNSTPYYPKTSETDGDTSHTQFYTADNGDYRLNALKTSVNNFVESVFASSPNSNIAVVSFADEAKTVSGFTNSSGKNTLLNGVENLEFKGATNSGLGMQRAATLLTSLNSNTAHTGHSEHKKIVIMFTDGEPTTSNDFETTVANGAISASKTIKNAGATVYTIGIFAGANGDLDSFGGTNANTFMHLVSSNYPEANNMTSHGDRNPDLKGKGYYLSATNASDLNEIFKKISYEVGGADNSELNSSTVVKDIIAPSFSVPENTSDIKFYTAECNGKSGDELTFKAREEATGLVATIDKDTATLDVSGFNFSENWCGYHSNSYGGKKLIIEFTVSPKAGFLGGNDVPTNGNTSGLYSNGTPVGLFEVPNVNVPIQDVTVTAGDKNVYLLGNLTAEQIKAGATAQCGTVNLDLAAENYGLEPWQYAYVTITATYTDASGNTITNLSDLKDDTTYTVSVTVTPKTTNPTSTEGTVATAKTNSATGKINVFKPELTFKDSTVYYGDNAPTSYDDHLTKTEWKHNGTLDSTVTMVGTAPILDMAYKPGTGVVDDKIATKDDIPVDVTVKIGSTDVTGYTTFAHQDCTDRNDNLPQGKEFLLHVNTCTLTITKAAGANTTIRDDEYFVFNIKKDGKLYTQVTIQGTGSVTISELPVGNYTVEEDASTAWRYTSAMDNSSVTLSKDSTSVTVTCTNTKANDKWLNFFNRVINEFSKANPTPDSQK